MTFIYVNAAAFFFLLTIPPYQQLHYLRRNLHRLLHGCSGFRPNGPIRLIRSCSDSFSAHRHQCWRASFLNFASFFSRHSVWVYRLSECVMRRRRRRRRRHPNGTMLNGTMLPQAMTPTRMSRKDCGSCSMNCTRGRDCSLAPQHHHLHHSVFVCP